MNYTPLPMPSNYNNIMQQTNTALDALSKAKVNAPGETGAFDSFWDWSFGNTDTGASGNLMPTLNAVSNLAQSWLGFQQLGMARDQLAFQKDAFNKNYGAQVQQYNTSIQDRQRARLNGNTASPFYQSIGTYMNQNQLPTSGDNNG